MMLCQCITRFCSDALQVNEKLPVCKTDRELFACYGITFKNKETSLLFSIYKTVGFSILPFQLIEWNNTTGERIGAVIQK